MTLSLEDRALDRHLGIGLKSRQHDGPPPSPWFDLADIGPDGDLRLDRWVQRRVAGPAHLEDPDGSEEPDADELDLAGPEVASP